MSLQTLDRTQWSYAEALAHVQNVTVARRAVEAAKLPPKPVPAYQTWNPPQDPTIAWKAEAETELLVALRDGDLIAQGRYTEERPNGWGYGATAAGSVCIRATTPVSGPSSGGRASSIRVASPRGIGNSSTSAWRVSS